MDSPDTPDLTIPDTETEEDITGSTYVSEAEQSVQADHTRMRMVQLAEAGEISQSVKYIKKAVSFISPFIPFIGAITGGATLGKHIMRQRNETLSEDTIHT